MEKRKFFSIFNLNPLIVIMKVTKHLRNATEVRAWRNGVETCHVKMLNGLMSCSGQIFQQSPLFFII